MKQNTIYRHIPHPWLGNLDSSNMADDEKNRQSTSVSSAEQVNNKNTLENEEASIENINGSAKACTGSESYTKTDGENVSNKENESNLENAIESLNTNTDDEASVDKGIDNSLIKQESKINYVRPCDFILGLPVKTDQANSVVLKSLNTSSEGNLQIHCSENAMTYKDENCVLPSSDCALNPVKDNEHSAVTSDLEEKESNCSGISPLLLFQLHGYRRMPNTITYDNLNAKTNEDSKNVELSLTNKTSVSSPTLPQQSKLTLSGGMKTFNFASEVKCASHSSLHTNQEKLLPSDGKKNEKGLSFHPSDSTLCNTQLSKLSLDSNQSFSFKHNIKFPDLKASQNNDHKLTLEYKPVSGISPLSLSNIILPCDTLSTSSSTINLGAVSSDLINSGVSSTSSTKFSFGSTKPNSQENLHKIVDNPFACLSHTASSFSSVPKFSFENKELSTSSGMKGFIFAGNNLHNSKLNSNNFTTSSLQSEEMTGNNTFKFNFSDNYKEIKSSELNPSKVPRHNKHDEVDEFFESCRVSKPRTNTLSSENVFSAASTSSDTSSNNFLPRHNKPDDFFLSIGKISKPRTNTLSSENVFSVPSTSSDTSSNNFFFSANTSREFKIPYKSRKSICSAKSRSASRTQYILYKVDVPFRVIREEDTCTKNGVTTTIIIQHQHITAMQEYSSLSFEELRLQYFKYIPNYLKGSKLTTPNLSANKKVQVSDCSLDFENHLKEIWKILECPVCLDVVTAPVIQCECGHHVCNTCWKRVLICPLCKKHKSRTRNYLAESLLEKILLPCKYRMDGCLKTFGLSKKSNHEDVCLYRSFNCIVENCQVSYRYIEMHQHLKATHHELVASESLIPKGQNYSNTFFKKSLQQVVQIFDIPWGLFFLCYNKSGQNSYLWMQVMTMKNEDEEFFYSLEISDVKQIRHISYKGPVIEYNTVINVQGRDSLLISEHLLENLKCNYGFNITVQIFKKE